MAQGCEHRELRGHYRLMKRYFESVSPERREVRPTATSLDTKRDIIYLEPVICWDVSQQPGSQSEDRTGSRDLSDQSELESCLHLFGQFSTSLVLLAWLPCNYGGFRVFSGWPGPPTCTTSIHPPITLGQDKTLKCFWTVCNILPVRQALYCVRDPRNSFIQYRAIT